LNLSCFRVLCWWRQERMGYWYWPCLTLLQECSRRRWYTSKCFLEIFLLNKLQSHSLNDFRRFWIKVQHCFLSRWKQWQYIKMHNCFFTLIWLFSSLCSPLCWCRNTWELLMVYQRLSTFDEEAIQKSASIIFTFLFSPPL
jgi:hypothetical protein